MDNQQQEVVKPEVSEDVKSASTEATENVPNSSVPYSRFSEVNDKYRVLEEKFDGLVKEQETVREKKLQEEGKFQELLVEKDKSIDKLSPLNQEKQRQKATQKKQKHYEFYQLLPKSKIEPAQVDAYKSTPKNASNYQHYRLQTGSFKIMEAAEQMRIRMILLDMPNPIIDKAVTKNGSTWYRVQIGPFPSRSQLNKATDLLVKNNIQPLLMSVAP